MKGSVKSSPATSAEKSSSGKKLIQARLPFKILSSPVCVSHSEENDGRKRKLSTESDLPAAKILCTSEVKENVSTCGDTTIVLSDDGDDIEEAPGNKGDSTLNPYVRLHKIDKFVKSSQNEYGRIVLSPKTPKASEDRDTSAGNNSSGKRFIIKLPLTNKKKRKLSEKFNAPQSPDRKSVEHTPKERRISKLFKRSATEATPKSNAAEITDDDNDTLSANIRLHVTNMSEDSVLESSKKVPVKVAESFLPEEAANDSELFSAMKQREKSTITPESRSSEAKDEVVSKNKKETLKERGSSLNPSKDAKRKIFFNKPEMSEIGTTSDDCEKISKTPHKDLNDSEKVSKRSLTPKHHQKFKEREEKIKQKEGEKLQKQKEKEEKERQRRKEKEEKEEQRRKEREEKEEQKRKEKEEKEEQRRKEKEEKEKKRLAEIEAKNEEKRKKEELKEEERRRKDEEKRKKEVEKEEAENKKRKAAEAFSKFFVQSKPPVKESTEEDNNSMDSDRFRNSTFMPFQVKGDMKLAPLSRRILDSREKAKLDKILADLQNPKPWEELYLRCLKSSKIAPRKDGKTWLADEDNASDCMVVEDELEGAGQKIDDTSKPREKYRAKFLYFHENQRPAYYGTWRKTSALVKPRRPFATDTKYFDYEVDSDDEWEEEEPGESLHGSDDEKESEDEYEVDNEFFVPHGHLSDEELQNEDEMDEDNSPEAQKAKLKILQQEFAQEMKKKTEKIKPRLVGIIWEDENGNKPNLCPSVIWESLNKRAMIFSEPLLVIEPEKGDPEMYSPLQEKRMPKKCQLTEEQIKDLIKLIHGNRHKREFIIREFKAFMSKQLDGGAMPVEYTKASLKEQISKLAKWAIIEDGAKNKKKLCWMVFPDILKQYSMEGLGHVNQWQYTLQPKRILKEAKVDDESLASSGEETTPSKQRKKKKHFPGITKFTKVITKKDERDTEAVASTELGVALKDTRESAEKIEKATPKPEPPKASPVVKKRVPLLMSVPRGQQIPENTKNALISDFLRKPPDVRKDPPDSGANPTKETDVPTIVIE